MWSVPFATRTFRAVKPPSSSKGRNATIYYSSTVQSLRRMRKQLQHSRSPWLPLLRFTSFASSLQPPATRLPSPHRLQVPPLAKLSLMNHAGETAAVVPAL